MKFKCNFCKYETGSKKLMREHVKKIHSSERRKQIKYFGKQSSKEGKESRALSRSYTKE